MGNTSSARRGKPWGETILCCVSPTEIHYEAPATQKSSTEIDNETITLSASNTTDTCTLNGAVGACGTASCIAAPVPYPPEAVINPDTSLILNMLDPENGPAAGQPYQVHYLGPPRPPCESERMATIRAIGKIGDNKKPDPEISNILKLMQTVFNAPATMCALFDEKRVFISEQEGGVIPSGDFPWRWTLCGWSMAFNNPQVLVIPDTLEDARFSNNEKVTVFPKVRFYCGAPLVASNGHRLGTLCFADVRPRKFDAAACVMVNNLAELVVRQLEKDIALKLAQKNNEELASTYAHLQRTIDCFDHCVVLLNTDAPGWRVEYANAAWTRHTGLPREEVVGRALCDVLECADGSGLPSPAHTQEVLKQHAFEVPLARVRNPSVTKVFSLRFRAAGRQAVDEGAVPVGVPAFLPVTGGEDKTQRYYFMVLEERGSKMSFNRSTRGSAWGGPASVMTSMTTGLSVYSDTCSTASIEGLELGHLLGRGSFGWVYYGTWFGTPVAVKVIDGDGRNVMCQAAGVHREALMASELRHPNVVSTLKYVVRSVRYARVEGPDPVHNSLHQSWNDGDKSPDVSDKLLLSADTGSAPNNACWAVIEAPLAEECDGDAELMSEEDAEVHRACQVKADAWAIEPKDATITHSKQHIAPTSDTGLSFASTSSYLVKQTWIIMEFCDRGCVQDAVDRGWLRDKRDCIHSHANMEAVLATATEVASAMCYLHADNIVHGDLTAWNVMLTASGATTGDGGRGWVAKVADFGLTRSLMQQSNIMTHSYGTITHMPPETLTDGCVSKAMDVYSFGVLMWQMYTGSRPWSGLTHAQIIMKVCQQRVPLQWDDQVPQDYRELAVKCMAYDADARPTFEDVISALQRMRVGRAV